MQPTALLSTEHSFQPAPRHPAPIGILSRPSPLIEHLGSKLLRALSPAVSHHPPRTPPAALGPWTEHRILTPTGGRLAATFFAASGTCSRGTVILAHPWVPTGQGYFFQRARLESPSQSGFSRHDLRFSRFRCQHQEPSGLPRPGSGNRDRFHLRPYPGRTPLFLGSQRRRLLGPLGAQPPNGYFGRHVRRNAGPSNRLVRSHHAPAPPIPQRLPPGPRPGRIATSIFVPMPPASASLRRATSPGSTIPVSYRAKPASSPAWPVGAADWCPTPLTSTRLSAMARPSSAWLWRHSAAENTFLRKDLKHFHGPAHT